MRRARIGGAVAPPAHCVQGCAMRTRPAARVCKRRYRPVPQRRPRPSGAAVLRLYRARGAIRRNLVRRLQIGRLQIGRRGVACAAPAMRKQRGRGAAELRDVGDPDADDPRLRGAVADPAQHRLGKGACDSARAERLKTSRRLQARASRTRKRTHARRRAHNHYNIHVRSGRAHSRNRRSGGAWPVGPLRRLGGLERSSKPCARSARARNRRSPA